MMDSNIKNEAGWNFDNSYKKLPNFFYTDLKPTPVSSPKLVILNYSLTEALGLNSDELTKNGQIEVFAGNSIPKGASPLAQAYAGHQFGYFTMLGDGRAILLGEQLTPKGERFDIQLKGSGKTPYSRGGDGRAAIKPMLREYIISEAMNALNIPTTRSLAVVTTGETVYRETPLTGAILTRVAASHIRVGTFQYAAKFGDLDDVKALADYTIKRHFQGIENNQNRYLALLREVVNRQASLIAKWQQIGFIHGVMNTDNMAISGETIDYGPCAFMDTFNSNTVFSSIDKGGRYSYQNQPLMATWNLARFAETLLPLIHDNEEKALNMAQETLSDFMEQYQNTWLEGMRSRLGISNVEEGDEELIKTLLTIMENTGADYNNTFRALTIDKEDNSDICGTIEYKEWKRQWQLRLSRQEEGKDSIHELMKNNNPSVIPRNHRVEEALEAAANGDNSVMERLLNILSKPFDYSLEQEEYCKLPEGSNKVYRTFCGT